MLDIIKRIFTGDEPDKAKSGRKILIIEDQSQSGIFLRNVLSGTYDILMTEDKSNGFEMAHENKPDLIVINARLAGEKTVNLCTALKISDRRKIPLY